MAELVVAAFWATFDIMKNVLPSLFIGLFLANISAHSGIAGRGERLIPIITRVTGLPAACALSVVLATGDRTAGMAAVALARTEAGLSDEEVIAANLVAKAPSVLQFFIFSFIPIMAAMYPWYVALHFLVVYFLAFLLISLCGVVYARLTSHNRQGACAVAANGETGEDIAWGQAAKAAAAKSWRPFIGMSGWMAGMSFVAMLFIKTGYLNKLTEVLPFLINWGLDGAVISLAGAGLVSMLGGVAAVGAALRDGIVAPEIVIPLLLTISVLHNFYDLFAASLPRYMGIYGHRLGLKVSLAGFAVTQAVMFLIIAMTITGWL